VNLYSLFVYIEHNGDESPEDYTRLYGVTCLTTAVFIVTTMRSSSLT